MHQVIQSHPGCHWKGYYGPLVSVWIPGQRLPGSLSWDTKLAKGCNPMPHLPPKSPPPLWLTHHQITHSCNQPFSPRATSCNQSPFPVADKCTPSGLKRVPFENLMLWCCITLPLNHVTMFHIALFIFFLAQSNQACFGTPCQSCLEVCHCHQHELNAFSCTEVILAHLYNQGVCQLDRHACFSCGWAKFHPFKYLWFCLPCILSSSTHFGQCF